jgi:hypothetical protein
MEATTTSGEALLFGKDWSYGQATIVGRTESGIKREHGWMGPATYHYVASVRPEDGSGEFSVTFDQHTMGPKYHYPEMGEQVRVKYDGKHSNAQIDTLMPNIGDFGSGSDGGLDPELAELMRLEEAERAGLGGATQSGPGGLDPELAELMRLEEEE